MVITLLLETVTVSGYLKFLVWILWAVFQRGEPVFKRRWLFIDLIKIWRRETGDLIRQIWFILRAGTNSYAACYSQNNQGFKVLHW